MTTPPFVDAVLERLMKKYDQHLYQNEDIPVQIPSLTNNIMPMLTQRWATGRDQTLGRCLLTLEPALQLASLFLTEDHCLFWFSQLTFGERRRRFANSSEMYITPTEYARSPEALAQVKAHLRAFGQVITFMIAPHSYAEEAWGITYSSRSRLPFRHKFQDSDFPPTLSHSGYARPVIVMNRGFDDFFSTPADVSFQEHSRALFMFATTLVHEIAHAYNIWLGFREEPHWEYNEEHAELGFSWEYNVLGRIINPLRSSTSGQSRFRALCSVQFKTCSTPAERMALFREFKRGSDATFTTLDGEGRQRNYPLLGSQDVRGGLLFTGTDTRRAVAAMHHIPCQWIVNWFQQDWWMRMRLQWVQQGAYVPPPLGNVFMLIYENNVYNAQVHRPLNRQAPIDANILESLYCRNMLGM